MRPKPGPAETGPERRRAFLQGSGESKLGPPSEAEKELEGLWDSVSAGPSGKGRVTVGEHPSERRREEENWGNCGNGSALLYPE